METKRLCPAPDESGLRWGAAHSKDAVHLEPFFTNTNCNEINTCVLLGLSDVLCSVALMIQYHKRDAS